MTKHTYIIYFAVIISLFVATRSEGCICPTIWMPVCDEQGNTYSNSCFAKCVNVTNTVPCPSKIEDNCATVRCAKPSCQAGNEVGSVQGQCCPVCIPTRTTISSASRNVSAIFVIVLSVMYFLVI